MAESQHLPAELLKSADRVVVQTQYGSIKGGRALNGAAIFLEVPFALPPVRFEHALPLPSSFRYEDKEYIYEASYAVQPHNDGQAVGMAFEDKVGLGKPTENPLFVNIACPPSFPSKSGFPVKVYIHGGFLQFGSPHHLTSQAQYIAAERSEVWVNIGYRLSAFGFLASDKPKVAGNFGFKDQWLALLWIRDNIEAFGITGLSAGGHSVHQLLHYASHLPSGEQAPFQSAILQSNSIITTPKTPAQLRPQFQALCRALKVDPDAPDVLDNLRDPERVPASMITHAIETDALGVALGTFRGALEDSWVPTTPDPMTWQRTGGFARGLQAHGVRSIVVGELAEEWYLYSIAHPATSMRDIELNMERYYQTDVVEKMMPLYRTLPEGAPVREVERLFGEMLSEGQVYLPIRLLARDLLAAGFPFVRYIMRWTPGVHEYVTHGTDRAIWALRLPILEPEELAASRAWLDRIAAEMKAVETTGFDKGVLDVLTLRQDKTIGWEKDPRWDELMRLLAALPGETPL
ncbi:carboxylesterase [Amylocystis lapponica]|nr:carboxylesterase [Amylocystis lapponica]